MAASDKSDSTKLTAEERLIQQRNEILWNNRNTLTKQGHRCMQLKIYKDAAINYEKYLRVLEIIFNCKPGELTPEHLKTAARTSEMSIIAGVYWDLIRIYDSSPSYKEKERLAVQQLIKFAPLTPMYTDLIEQVEKFHKIARQPEVIKPFLVSAGKASRCFIATAAFNSSTSKEVMALRQFRDTHLKSNFYGRKFIYFYYKISPQISCILDRHSYLKKPTRWALRALIKCVS